MPTPSRVDLRCESCAYFTSDIREAMSHAEDTGHKLSGPGAIEDTTLTVSLERD